MESITPEMVNAYFTPLDYLWYLMAVFGGMVVYYQFKWAKTCKRNIMLLVAKSDGHGDFILAPQEGGSVTITNMNNGDMRIWPINELATTTVPYPGVAFVPSFMQKTIRLVQVDEWDWEPRTNRSPHLLNVASPNVVILLKEIMKGLEDGDKKDKLEHMLKNISTSPTREMIASPAVLANLILERITSVVMTVNKEMLDSLSGLQKKLSDIVTPRMFWLAIGAIIILLGFVLYLVFTMAADVTSLKDALQGLI